MDKYGLVKIHNPYEKFLKSVLLGLILVLTSALSVTTGFFGLNNLGKKDEVYAKFFAPVLSASPTIGGTVGYTGSSGSYTLNAVANSGYYFSYWSVDIDDPNFGQFNTIYYNATQPISYNDMAFCSAKAYFVSSVTYYTVNAYAKTFNLANPSGYTSSIGGNINIVDYGGSADATDTASILSGVYVEIYAAVNSGYTFKGWYGNSGCTSLVSTNTIYGFNLTASTDRYAKFSNLYEGEYSAASGSGTLASPYLIASAQNLSWVAYQTNLTAGWSSGKYFVQTADISLDDYNSWIPIGHTNAFQGSYDGGNYIIKDMYIYSATDYSYLYAGLFGYTNGATIANVNLISPYINISESSNSIYAGGLIGYAIGTTTVNYCAIDKNGGTANNTITVYGSTGSSGHTNVGGIVGNADNGPSISYSYSNVSVYGYERTTGTYTAYVGGLVGSFYAGASSTRGLFQSFYTGTTVYSSHNGSGNSYAGGLIGRAYASSGYYLQVERCYVKGITSLSASTVNSAGTLVGQASYVNFGGLIYAGVSYNNYYQNSPSYGTYGIGTASNCTNTSYNSSVSDFTVSSNLNSLFAYSYKWVMDTQQVLTAGYPILRAVNNLFVTISTSPSAGGYTNPATGNYAFALGVAKTISNTPNTGYQRNGVSIDSVSQGTLSSYTFSAADARGTHTYVAYFNPAQTTISFNFQGGSGGTPSATAYYDSAMPSITMPTLTSYTFDGYFTGTGGSGTQYYNADGSSTRNWNLTNITYTLYAKWVKTPTALSVYAHYDSGSGYTYGDTGGTVDIVSYGLAAGASDAISVVWGDDYTIKATPASGYIFMGWFTTGSGTTLYSGIDATSSETIITKIFGAQTVYAHFTNQTWLPHAAGSFAGGTGTSSSPYLISNNSQLAKLAYDVYYGTEIGGWGAGYDGAYFKLTANIDLSAYLWFPIGYFNGTISVLGQVNHPFMGYFDGQGYTVSNMNIGTLGNLRTYGLFGYIANPRYIKNVGVTGIINVNMSLPVTARATVGGLIGGVTQGNYLEKLNTLIENVWSSVSITSTSNREQVVGGIVGGNLYNESQSDSVNINKAYFNGSINATTTSGESMVGGIVGFLQSDYDEIDPTYGELGIQTISNVYNRGTISVTGNSGSVLQVGGIAGYLKSRDVLSKAYNYATISASGGSSNYIGSLVGRAGGLTTDAYLTIAYSYYYPLYGTNGVGYLEGSSGSSVSSYYYTSGWTTQSTFSGFDFSGGIWAMSTSAFNNGYPVIAGLNNYVASFDANGGSITGIYKLAAAKTGSDTPGSYLSNATASRTYYTLNSWNTNSAGTGSTVATSTAITGDVTWYAKWTPISYRVHAYATYNTSGSTYSQGATGGTVKAYSTSTNADDYEYYDYPYNSTVTLIATAANTGYYFAGWYAYQDGGTQQSSNLTYTFTMPGGSTLYYYARYTHEQYTINFDEEGGGAVSNITNYYGNAITLPTPTKTGYTFGGWWSGDNGTGTQYTWTTMPDLGSNGSTTTVYAKWTANIYEVTLNQSAATVAGTTAVYVKYATGYYKESSATTQITSSTNAITAPQRAYTVTYNYNSGSGSPASAVATYTFNGYYTASSGGTQYIASTGYLTGSASTTNFTAAGTLYAQWTSASVTLPTPTRTGYTFGGWYSDSGLTTSVGGAGASYTPTAGITLYAKWTAINYSITVAANGGTGGSSSPATYNISGGSQTATLTHPTRANYTLDGYTVSGHTGTIPTVSGTTLTIPAGTYGSLTLTANWTANVYTITLNQSAATTAGTATIYEKYATGYYKESGATTQITTSTNAITAPQRAYTVTYNYNSGSGSPASAVATYTFNGYYTASSGGTQYIASTGYLTGSASTTNFTAAGTLYAQWTSASVTLPTPTRTGYTFGGWYSDAGLTTSVGAGGASYTPTAGITLYAKWTANSYTLTVDPNGGTWSGSTSEQTFAQNYDTSKSIVAPSADPTGYDFYGWLQDGYGVSTNYGNIIYRDTFFKSGVNSASIYNNYHATAPVVSVGTTTASSDNPTDSSSMLEIITSGTGSYPGLGGFVQSTLSYANAIFYQVLVAKIPVGYTLNRASNSCGDGYTADWLTPQAGTGDWELYVLRYNCGSTGTFSTFGHMYLTGTAPVTWWVAAATIYDATGVTVTAASATHAMDTATRYAEFKTSQDSTITYYYKEGAGQLLALYLPNDYTVTLDKQNGSGGSASVVATYDRPMPSASAPTREGYTFGGYYDGTNGTGTQYYNVSMVSQRSWDKTSNTTLYAKWTIESYTIYFDEETGSTVSDITANFGTTITLPTSTKSNFTFGGWWTGDNGTGTQRTWTTMPDLGSSGATVTLYARWTYRVTYNVNGATGLPNPTNLYVDINIPDTTTLPSVGTMVNTGFTFSGWNTLANGTGTNYAAGATYSNTTGNITLYAKWVTTITLEAGTGSSGATSGVWTWNDTNKEFTTGLNYNQAFGTLPTAPTKSGYTFEGWYTASAGTGTKITTASLVSQATYYANWTVVITLNAQGGTGVDSGVWDWTSPSFTANLNSGGTIGTLPTNPTRSGYTFAGWWTGTYGTGTQVTTSTAVSTALTYYAKWTYVVTFNANGGTGSPSIATVTITDGSTGTLATVGTLAFSGFTFDGWNLNNNGSGTNYAAGSSYSNTSGNITLYARWYKTITLDADYENRTGASGTTGAWTWNGSPTFTYTRTYYYNATLGTLPANPTRTGYTFANWYTGTNGSGTQVTTSTVVGTQSTYYAKWTYVVTFNANGGTGSPSVATVTITDGSTGTLATVGTLAFSGFTFDGWNTSNNGSGTNYAAGATYSNTSGDITLYARWYKTITLDADYENRTGVSGTTGSWTWNGSPTFTYTRTYYYNALIAALPADPTQNYYTFGGWYTGTGGSGSQISTATSIGTQSTYYAKWTAITYTVTYDENGGSTITDDTYTVESATFNLKTTSTRNGYTFASWKVTVVTASTVYKASASFAAVNDTITQIYTGSHGNITVQAQWTAINYTITVEPNTGTGGSVSASTYNISTSPQTRTVTHPTKTGYAVSSYTVTGHSGTIPTVSGTTLTIPANTYGNLTLTANWTAINYTITVAANGGTGGSSSPATYNISGSSQETTLTHPTRTGYTLNGYTVTGHSGTIPTVSGTTLTIPANTYGNLTLTANWTAIVYTITLNQTDATTTGTATIYEKYNTGYYKESGATTQITTSANAITVPQRAYTVTYNYNSGSGSPASAVANYIFNGHYTASSGGTQYISSTGYLTASASTTNFTAAGTLYAQWSSGSVTLPTPTRTGYTFAGWYSDAGLTTSVGAAGASYTPTAAITLYAKWDINNYDLTVIASTNLVQGNTGGNVKINSGTSGATASLANINYNTSTTITATSNTGYSFMAWNTAVDGSGTQVSTNAAYTFNMPASDTTYFAIFRQNFTIQLYAVTNGVSSSSIGGTVKVGSGTAGATYSTSVPYSTSQTITGALNTGFTFLGWYDSATSNANLINSNLSFSLTMPFSHVTYYAWFLGNSVTISMANSPSAGGTSAWKLASTNNQNLATSGSWASYTANRVGVTLTIAETPSTGYTFTSWAENGVNAVASSTSATTTYLISATDSSVTFTANYIANLYMINFNVNGGNSYSNIILNSDLDKAWQQSYYNAGITWNSISAPSGVNAQVVSFYDANTDKSGYWFCYEDYAPQEPNTTYTISIYVKTVDSNFQIRPYTADNSETGRQYGSLITIPNDGEWHRVSWTITTPSDTQSDSLSFQFTYGNSQGETQRTYLCAPQMEVGSTATTFNFGRTYARTNAVLTNYVPVNPTRTGYTFVGWNTASNGSGTTKTNASIKAPNDETWYAQWTPITYTVAYNSNKPATASGSISGTTASSTHTYDVAKALTTNGYTLTGWAFDGWNTLADGTGTSYTNGQSVTNLTSVGETTVTLYAQWTQVTYTVAYNSNKPSGASGTIGGSTASSTHTYDVAKALTTNGYTLTGWTFASWNSLANGTGTTYTNSQSVTNLTSTSGSTVTLYAQWTPITYTVAYNSNKPATASANIGGSTASSTHTYDTAKALTTNGYTLTGWVFASWNSLANGTGTTYTNSQSVSNLSTAGGSTVTLYAQWTPFTYTVAYNSNKPASASGTISGSTASSTHTYDVAKNLTTNGYSLIGWTFVNWDSASDGSGTNYTNGQSVTNLTSTSGATVTLYAQWTPITYYVAFNGNNSTSGSMSNQTFTYDVAQNLTANAYGRTGYTYANWNTVAGGTGTTYTNSQSVTNLTSTSGATVTLYAQWTPNIYKVTLDNQNATTAGTTAYWYMYNTVIGGVYYYTDAECTTPLVNYTITIPTKTGYIFGGYYTQINGGGTNYVDASGVCINSLYSTVANNITLYAKWTAITYTVAYNANKPASASGTIGGSTASSTHTYDVAKNLTTNGYTLTGWTFASWNSLANGTGTTYTNGQSVTNLSSTNGSTVTLYAQWTQITYTVAYNSNKPTGASGTISGSTASSTHTYDVAKNLTTNGYSLTGWTFASWNTASDGSGTNYANSASVTNLSSTSGATVTLYAQWTPITYTVSYNSNKPATASGTIGGSTANSTHTYDSAKSLNANGYTLTGWAFANWNSLANGTGTSYANSVSVTNLTSVAGATVTLYAQWTQITYTVAYNANKPATASGTIGGSTASSTHTYDVAKNLTTNGYTLTGWTFVNWNSLANGTGTTYTNSQSVTNLTSTSGATITLYAQWTAITYTVAYNANKPASASGTISGTTASSTHTYDVAKALTTNGYSLIGWTFTGWDSASDGSGTNYTNGQSVSNLTTTNGTTVILYAQWTAITYTIAYNSNKPTGASGTIGGSTASSTHTYDTAKALTANGYTLTGWTFVNWDSASDGSGTNYTNGQSVTNLTSTASATINLYAQWTAITYTVTYDSNKPATASGTISGTTNSSTHTYDTAKTLTANGYTLTGWTFANWNTVPAGTGTTYANSASVSNLTSVGGSTVTLYAQWIAITYTVTYNSNKPTGASGTIGGSTANSTHTYDTAKVLTTNGYTLTGWTFSSWNSLANGTGTTYTNGQSVTNLSSGSGSTVTLYAQWTPITYTIAYNSNKPTGASANISGSTASSIHTYDTAKALTINGYTLTGWTFASWNSVPGGTGTTYTNGQSVSNLSSTGGSTVTLYAQWTAITYTITYNSNKPTGASGTISGTTASSTHTYDTAKTLTSNGYSLIGWTFVNWDTANDGSGTNYTNGQSVTNLTSTAGATINLYAQWTPITYTVAYDGNKPTGASASVSGSTASSTHTYDTAKALTANGYTLTGWVFANWNTASDGSGIDYTNSASVSNLTSTSGATVTLYAQWTAITYTVTYDANKPASASGTIGGSTVNSIHTYDVAKVLTTNGYTLTGWTFVNWNTIPGGTGTTYTNSQSVTNLTSTAGVTINLYAQWAPITYTVAYNSNKPASASGTIGGSTASSTHTYDTAKALTANGYTLIGWTFASWNSLANGTGTTYTNSQSVSNLTSVGGSTVTLYAQWTIITYTITYVSGNAGVSMLDVTHSNPSTYTYESATITFIAPTVIPIEYNFTGWDPTSIVTHSTGNKTITANFELKARTVTFMTTTNGISFVAYTTLEVNYGQTAGANMPSNPSNGAGYTFTSWNTANNGSGSAFTSTTVVTENITVYAIFTATVTFNGNGGTGHTPTTKAVQLNTQLGTLPTNPTLINYIFMGWFTATSGGTQIGTTLVINGPVTLYAQWDLEYWTTYAVQPSGSGTALSPYIITTPQELAWVAKQTNTVANWSVGVFVELGADINLTGYRWKSIGDFNTGTTASAFSGTFRGQNYDITNMLIDEKRLTTNTYQGLFGYVNGTLIEGIRLKTISVTVNNTGLTAITYVGGLVAYNMTKISECYSSDGITITTVHTAYVGGLVGYANTLSSTIEESYSNANINATVGTVSHDASLYVGGLVGYNNTANITNAYSQGNVTGKNLYGTNRVYIGGLIGYHTGTGSEIKNTYVSGYVTVTLTSGGYSSINSGSHIGYFGGGEISASYYNSDYTNLGNDGVGTLAGGSLGITAKTLAQMRLQATYLPGGNNNWPFGTIWIMDTVGIQNYLPLLAGVGNNIIFVSSTGSGAINPSATIISDGKITQLFTFIPSAGYEVGTIEIDETALVDTAFTNAVASGYQFTQTRGIHSVYADFIFEANVVINSIFDSTVESGMISFVKLVDSNTGNIWMYPLSNGSSYSFTVYNPASFSVQFINPTNHGTTSTSITNNQFTVSSSRSVVTVNMTVTKTQIGYIYDTYYIQ